ncbi:MAG: cyclic nucleotide-binding domain-containing protein [Vulcanimicrobiaceae bacterium]
MSIEAPINHRDEYTRQYKKGDTIFLKGDIGNCMYVLISGQVQIKLEDLILDVINPGGMFGEMGIIESAPRSAMAIATSPSTVLVIDEDHFLELVHEQPFFALKVLRTAMGRVRKALKLVPSVAHADTNE